MPGGRPNKGQSAFAKLVEAEPSTIRKMCERLPELAIAIHPDTYNQEAALRIYQEESDPYRTKKAELPALRLKQSPLLLPEMREY